MSEPRLSAASPCGEDAERACRFILEQVEAREGRCAYQGQWPAPLADRATLPLLPPHVRAIAEQRIRRVPRAVAEALVLWAKGAEVVLYDDVPRAPTVLHLQARGARCVSLLPAHAAPAPHADALAFALHDLCHLAKFLDPEHHAGQVGFFSAVARARQRPAWAPFEGGFDPELSLQWNHVISDMNGSAVFLFAAMKMKLKMAVRRRCARTLGAAAPEGGPLSRVENTAYEDAQHALFELLDLTGGLAAAAHQTSAKRSEPHAARELLEHFATSGAARLSSLRAGELVSVPSHAQTDHTAQRNEAPLLSSMAAPTR